MEIKKFENENIEIFKTEEINNHIVSDEEINEKYISGEVRIVTEQARYPWIPSVLCLILVSISCAQIFSEGEDGNVQSSPDL